MVIDSTALAAAATNFSPLLTTVGFGGLVGFLIGFVIKKLFKILAIIAGVFFAVLIYLGEQGIVNVNWDKLQGISQGVLSTVTNTITNSTVSRGVGESPAASSSSLLPTTTMTLTNLGTPLTGSAALGFAIGIMKG
jgi:uncharacterized membrane protein (Fun14 family)